MMGLGAPHRPPPPAYAAAVASTEPDVCKVPFMIDSSKFEIIEAGLQNVRGWGGKRISDGGGDHRGGPPEREGMGVGGKMG